MQELLEIIAKALVNNPDVVTVNKVEEDSTLLLELKVAPEDMGKVIGRQGRIARAIRTVVRSASARDNRRVLIEIMENV
ncbi:MAG: KH domain-containing protein [Firmicutes bacterium]|nr:KH domain-containing protein [Bacillota bacterium]